MNRLRVQPLVPSQSYCSQPLHGVLRTKSSKHCSNPPGSGAGLWMTPLSSTRKSTNKASFNTSTVLTLQSSLQWRTTGRLGPFPPWTPLLNLRLMAHYHCVQENPLIQTSTYSGIVTITSQPNLLSSTPFPIGPLQCVASLSCSNKKRTTSGRL